MINYGKCVRLKIFDSNMFKKKWIPHKFVVSNTQNPCQMQSCVRAQFLLFILHIYICWILRALCNILDHMFVYFTLSCDALCPKLLETKTLNNNVACNALAGCKCRDFCYCFIIIFQSGHLKNFNDYRYKTPMFPCIIEMSWLMRNKLVLLY